MPTAALIVMLALAPGAASAADLAAAPPTTSAAVASRADGRPRTAVALYTLSPVAFGAGYAMAWLGQQLGQQDDPLAGLPIVYGYLGTLGLAAVGAHQYMRWADAEPRWWAWWASFAPVAASYVLASHTSLLEAGSSASHAVLLGGLAASVASFGLVAFTPLGYSAAGSERPGSARDFSVAPKVSVLRTPRGSTPVVGASLLF